MAAFERRCRRLSKAGVAIVDPCDLPSAEQLQDARSSVFRTEFKAALNTFLRDHGHPCGINSLTTLIRWNEAQAEAIPYGQSLLLAAEATAGLDDPQYRADRARDIVLSRTAGIDAAIAASGVDALIAPMTAAAKCTGKAGAPVLAIPVGLDGAAAPFGVTLYASKGRDRHLLDVGAAIAAIIGDRHVPNSERVGRHAFNCPRACAEISDAFATHIPSRLADVFQDILEIADAMRMAYQPGMHIEDEMAPCLGAVGQELVERFSDGLSPALGADAPVPHRDDIIELQRHGERDERARGRAHQERLFVVRPVEHVADAETGEQGRRASNLPYSGPCHPIGRTPAARCSVSSAEAM